MRVVRASLRGGGGQGDVLACFTYSDRWMQGEPYRGPYPIGQKAERVYEIFHRKLIGEKVLVPAGGAAPRHVLTDARVVSLALTFICSRLCRKITGVRLLLYT